MLETSSRDPEPTSSLQVLEEWHEQQQDIRVQQVSIC